MKKISFILKNFMVFLFFVFTTQSFSQSANDNCSNASVLTLGTTCSNTAFTFTSNTVETGAANPSLCNTVSGTRDGWYRFTTGASTNQITLTSTANRPWALSIYSGNCSGFTQIACNNAAANTSITLNPTVLPNTTYYVLISRTNTGTNSFTGNVCVYDTTVTTNFTCATATTLPCATTNLAGTTVGSSDIAHGTACSMANYGAWYTFVGDGQITTISSTAGSGYDHEMSISSGSCGSFTSLTCQDSGLSGGTESYTFTTSIGVNYYVYISHYSSGSTTTGTFTISRSCTAAPTPPANDNCNTAIPLTINTSCSYSTYTTVGATASTTPSTPPAPGCGSYSGGDVWFSFTVPANGQVTVDTQTGGMTDSGMAWYTGTCGALTLLECDDDDSANGAMSSITRTGLTPGSTIYVRVWEYSNDNPGTFGICATSPGPCVTPIAQASGFTSGTISSTAFPATFSGTADSYLVIRSTSATPPSQPIDGVIYTAANIGTLGSGLTVVQNGTSTSIAGTGLTGNTGYYYYIYAYNNTGCSGGPLYNASGPLTGNAVTCPSTPSPVSTSSTLSSINFSWPSSLGGGTNSVTYEIQITTDAAYTTNIAGSPFSINHPTTNLNVTGLASNTTYYYRIRANNGCWSTYTTGSAITGYCAFSSSNSTYWISNFSTTGGSTNINRNSTYSAGGYANYSSTDIVTQILGQSFNFSTTMSSGTHGINIYVDWNNDLDFNDTGELVFASGAYVGSSTGTITIPTSASIGNHRMRVVANYLDTNPSACGSNSYTEAEDYTINVVAPVACTGTPNAGTTILTPNTGWAGSNYTVSATGYSIASNLTFQWQFSTDAGVSWTNAGASSSTYSNYTATAPTSGLVHWQLVVTCTNSGISSNSNVGIFTTMEVSSVVTGCPNVVSGGLGLNGADPTPFNCTASSTCVDLEATYLDLGETTDYIVEPILYNPPFAFNGLANPVSVNTDDVWSPIVNLPFDFCFYGNTYNQCVIGSNGILTFNTSLAGGSSGYSFSNNIPISGDPRLIENSIFGVFHDINPGVGGEVGWELITLPTGCRALVASWYNVPMFDENSILYTGMMVLYENSNIIEVYIQEKNIDNFGAGTWNDGNAVVGIQNATGTLASVAPGRNGLDPNWATTNEAWRFVPNGNSIASIAWYEGSGTTGPVVGTTPTINVCPTSTTTYTAEITYTLCDGRTIKEIDETTVTVNGAKVWNGSVDTDWNVANNWTPSGVPTAMDCVVIADTANDPIISGTNYIGLGLNLTINNNATLTVNSNNYLTITDWVNINATSDLVLQNSASLIQTNNATNQGTMHMTRTANIRKLDYVYWSSPVTNFSINSVSPGTNGFKYKWLPTIPANINGFGNWNTTNENMVLGKGYIVRGPDSFTNSVAAFNAVFTGTPNNGIITTPIQRGTWNGGNYSTGVSTTLGTNEDDNWNLVGNPYPSAIDAIDFLTLNTNIDGFINLWTHGTLPNNSIADPFYEDFVYNYTPGDYITYNSSGASAGPGTFSGSIGAGQGFFVLMNHTSATNNETITFNNSLRSSSLSNNQFYRTSNESGKIWLDLIATNGSNVRSLLAYVSDATNNRDRMFDAFTNEKINLNLFSLIGNETMKIQGRSLPFDENDKVPFGMKIPQDGNYSIGIGALEGFFTDQNQNIYLEDLQENIIHNLREAPYSFSSNAGRYTDRFILRYTNETLGNDDLIADESNLWVISSDNLSVKSTKNEILSIRVFDVLGRELAYYPKVNSYETSLNKIQKNNTGLIIQVTLTNGSIINKKVIY